MQKVNKFTHFINSTNTWVGNAVSFGLILITAIAMLEVILRYIFNRPTVWAWEVNGQLFAAVILLGGGYALLHNAHVKLDVVYDRLSLRRKALVDIATFPLFLLFFVILLWQGFDMAYTSLRIQEVSPTFFGPPLYPIKMCVPVAAFLVLLQGLAKFVRDLTSIMPRKTGRR